MNGSLEALHDLFEGLRSGPQARVRNPDDGLWAQSRELEEVLLGRLDVDQAGQELLLLLRLLAEREGLAAAGELSRLMIRLEEEGRLDRKVELLPDNETFAERYASNRPLTRAELGVLISYAKIALFDNLMASSVPDDPYFDATLHGYFSSRMRKEFARDIDTHRLRNEIVAEQ